jgi:hypothetical protein
MEASGQFHAPAAFAPELHSIRRNWMDPGAGLDSVEKRGVEWSCGASNVVVPTELSLLFLQ